MNQIHQQIHIKIFEHDDFILYFVVLFMMVKRAKKWPKMSEDTKWIGGISAIAGAVIIVAILVMNEALSH
jgi:hypothetical protein